MDSLINTLKTDVASLATSAGRKVGTEGHEVARRYLIQRLQTMGLQPFESAEFAFPYQIAGKQFCNVAAIVPGTVPTLAPIVIGAHYDSVIESHCADDNAAAIAISLVVAGLLDHDPLQRDVIIAFFDAEEPPYYHGPAMGSIRFYEDYLAARDTHAAIVMDLVGHDVPFPDPSWKTAIPSFANLLFMTGVESHHNLQQIVLSIPRNSQLPIIAVENRLVGDVSDHHVFRLNHVPFLFFSCGRWPHYHQVTDTPDRLNYEKMARIARHVLLIVEALATAALLAPAPAEATILEIEMIHAAFGSVLPFVLHAIGLQQLETREDLDMLAAGFQNYFRL